MFGNKFNKRLCMLAIAAIPALLIDWWTAYYFYRFYTFGHAPTSMIVKWIFFPSVIWTLLFIFTFIAWRKKWYWFVFVPLITSYPWMYNNIIALYTPTNMIGSWYWTSELYLWSKFIYYAVAFISSIFFIINKLSMKKA